MGCRECSMIEEIKEADQFDRPTPLFQCSKANFIWAATREDLPEAQDERCPMIHLAIVLAAGIELFLPPS